MKTHLLLYENKVVIPQDQNLRRKIIAQYHDNPIAGHPGELKTYRKAK
jgi:hypothetical protein